MKYIERVFLALLLLTWCGCAHAPPRPERDTPQFRACKRSCEVDGEKAQAVIEDEDSVLCVCKKAPEPGT